MRLYFHLHDAQGTVADLEGREVDPGDVRAVALIEARAIIGVDALDGRIDLGQSIEVVDDAGTLHHRLRFADAVRIVSPA